MPAPALTIAHVDSELGFSGGEVQVFLLVEGLRRAGFRNVVIAPPGSATLARASELGLETRAVAMRNELDLPAVFGISKVLREQRVELAHLHTMRSTWLGGWAARWAGVPAITTRRMDRDVRPGWRTRCVYQRLTRRVAAISEGVATCLQRGGVPQERTRLIWSAVDADALRPVRARDVVRAELGLAEGELCILAAGALVERKGLDVLIDALAGCAAHAVRWRCFIAGEGEHRGALEQHIVGQALTGRVTLLGHRADVPDLLQAADVFAMPSRREGLGVAALEAMASALPVVASRVGGLAQVVEHERSGLLVPPDDARALREVLERLCSDADLRARLGAAGRARVRERFSAAAMVASYVELYREVLGERAR